MVTERLPQQNKFQRRSGEDIDDYLYKMMVWIEEMYELLARNVNTNIVDLQGSTVTGYIDLPLESWFLDYQNNAQADLAPLAVQENATLAIADPPAIWFLDTAGNSWRTFQWLILASSTANEQTTRFHQNFRIPDDYIDGSDLTLHLSSCYVVVDNSTAATTATLDATARRNIPSSGKEGFGVRADPAVDTWTANTDLIDLAAQSVLRHTAGDSGFDENTWTIDGDNSSFPLTPGSLMQIELTSVLNDGGSDAAMYMANAYLTYDKYRVMPTE